MKLKIGRYHGQWGLGLNYTYFTHFNGVYKSIVLELACFYIELIINDYPEDWDKNGGK